MRRLQNDDAYSLCCCRVVSLAQVDGDGLVRFGAGVWHLDLWNHTGLSYSLHGSSIQDTQGPATDQLRAKML